MKNYSRMKIILASLIFLTLSCLSSAAAELAANARRSVQENSTKTPVGRNESLEVLQSPRIIVKGDWGPWQYCPPGGFVVGMNLKIQSKATKGDLSGLNAIALSCKPIVTNDEDSSAGPLTPKSITSLQGPQGDYRGWNYCRGPAIAFQIRSLDEFKCGDGDNLGATDFKLFCASDEPPPEIAAGIIDIGTWRDKRHCSKGRAICGIKTQVDFPKNHSFFQGVFNKCQFDNTGLNNVDTACCKVPNPVEKCTPDTTNIWVNELGCGPKLSCKKSFQKGLSFSKSKAQSNRQSADSSSTYGASLDGGGQLLRTRFEHQLRSTKMHGLELSEILGSISSTQETIEINMSLCQGIMQQMVLTCGIIEAKTGIFRCADEDKIFSMNSSRSSTVN